MPVAELLVLRHNFNGLLELSLCKRGRGNPQQGCPTSVLLLLSSLLSSHNIGCCDTRMTKHTLCCAILTCDSLPHTEKFQTGVQALAAVPGISFWCRTSATCPQFLNTCQTHLYQFNQSLDQLGLHSPSSSPSAFLPNCSVQPPFYPTPLFFTQSSRTVNLLEGPYIT